MKTTLELPDHLFRQVKSTAASRGMMMKQFIAEALTEKLAAPSRTTPKPWMALAGCAANDPEMLTELNRIDKIIDDEFGQVDQEDWK